MEKIQISNVAKTKNGAVVMDEISLKVHEGEIFVLVGNSGSGKTLISKVMLALVKKSAGHVSIGGNDTSKGLKLTAKSLGTVIEQQQFYPNKSGYKTVQHTAMMNFKTLSHGRIVNIMRLLGLKRVMHWPVARYTKSQIARLKIAVAIVFRPEVLVLDAPFNGLTEEEARAVRVIIKTMADKLGTAVFITAKDLTGIEEICDTVAIICDGMLICTKSYNDMIRAEEPFSKICITTPLPNFSAKIIEQECGFETNLCGSDVIVNTLPFHAQSIYDTLISKGIKIFGMRKINRSLNEQFYTILSRGSKSIKDTSPFNGNFYDTSDCMN